MMEEIIQASKARIAQLNKIGVAQGRIGITEPERQHLPALTNMEEYEDWVERATSYVMDKRLVREERNKEIVGREITIGNLFQDVTTGDGGMKKCSHVMVLGAAGMGKTTLLRRIALYCGEGILEGKFAIVLEFRTFPLDEKIPPCEVLLGGIFSDQDHERMKERYQWILDNQDKILFIIDSLDTLPFDLDSERPRIEYHTPATVDVILHNLLARDLFPKSLIVSSSREYKVRNLHPSVRPDRCVLLDGLKHDSVKDLIDGFLGDDKGTEVKEHINTKCPNLWPLLSIPIVLVFALVSLGEDGFKPETMSGILIKFFICLVNSPHVHVKNILIVLRKLMPLSLDGIRKECVLFTLEDLKSFGLDPNEVTDLGILIPQSHGHGTFFSAKLMQNDRFFLYFNHQTEQECLAALHVLSMTLTDFESFIEHELSERKFTVVRRLICGILFNDEVLDAVLRAGLCKVPDVHEKKNILIRSLGVALKKYQEPSKESKLLELFIVLSECREGVTELIRSSVKKIDFSQLPLSPSDVQAVAYVMKQCEYLEAVDLWSCQLNDEKMNVLMRTITPSNLKFTQLDVSGNEKLGPKGAHLLGKLVKNHEVKTLAARYGSIQGCESVEKFIEGLGDAKMDDLDLWDSSKPHYTHSLLDLLPRVEKKLGLGMWKINESQQQELQQRLNEIGSPSLKVRMLCRGEYINLKASLMDSTSDTTDRACPSGVGDVKDASTGMQTDVEQDATEDCVVGDDGIEAAASDTTGRDCPTGVIDVKDASTEIQTDVEQDVAEDCVVTGDRIEAAESVTENPDSTTEKIIADVSPTTGQLEVEADPQSTTISVVGDDEQAAVETETPVSTTEKIIADVSPATSQLEIEADPESTKISAVGDDEQATVETETSDEIFTSGTSIVSPRGTSIAPEQPKDETNLESAAPKEKERGPTETDKTGRDCPSGVGDVKDASTEKQTDVEQDVAEDCVVGDDGIETVASGISHSAALEQNPVIQISRLTTQEKIISRAHGGKINPGNCSVKFPPGLLKHDANIKVTVESGAVSDRSTQGIPISPTIGCDLSHVDLVPGYEMEVKILAYCFASKPVPIALLSKAFDSEDWVIEKELMLGRDRKLKFKTKSFSRKYYTFMRTIGLGWLLNFPVIPHLYYNKFGVFKSYLCIDDKSVIDSLENKHKSNGFVPAFVMPEHLIAKLNESIGVELQCAYPTTASFGDNNRYNLVSDELIVKAYDQKDFVLGNIPDHIERGFVEVHFTLAKIPPDTTPRPMLCRLEWPMFSATSAVGTHVTGAGATVHIGDKATSAVGFDMGSGGTVKIEGDVNIHAGNKGGASNANIAEHGNGNNPVAEIGAWSRSFAAGRDVNINLNGVVLVLCVLFVCLFAYFLFGLSPRLPQSSSTGHDEI